VYIQVKLVVKVDIETADDLKKSLELNGYSKKAGKEITDWYTSKAPRSRK
jgi:hypothetical protein